MGYSPPSRLVPEAQTSPPLPPQACQALGAYGVSKRAAHSLRSPFPAHLRSIPESQPSIRFKGTKRGRLTRLGIFPKVRCPSWLRVAKTCLKQLDRQLSMGSLPTPEVRAAFEATRIARMARIARGWLPLLSLKLMYL